MIREAAAPDSPRAVSAAQSGGGGSRGNPLAVGQDADAGRAEDQ
jgi:hypothetical protein